MKKWGHVEGTGIGARGDGLVHALTTEHVAKPTNPNETLSKRQLAKQRVAAANAKKRKWVQAPSARGRIVDANADARAVEEREKLGDASRIICLVGMVESEDDVDEEMPEEIGEECSKYGIVERVVLHMVEPPPPEPSECLRVFVVFSGMAGAWRAIKEMDGRFFGGRKIVCPLAYVREWLTAMRLMIRKQRTFPSRALTLATVMVRFYNIHASYSTTLKNRLQNTSGHLSQR